jgi:hypothetical protein
MMPTLTEPLFLQCGHPIEPVQNGAARRCMVPLNQHDGLEALDHAYVSLMVPCLHCPVAIYWTNGAWRDTHGDTGHHARYYRDGQDPRAAMSHEPDPRYL